MRPRVRKIGSDWRGHRENGVLARVTVQVVTKDRPLSLYGWLSSLICQKYQDWDLVIVDDSEVPCWRKPESECHKLMEVIARCGHNVKAFHVKQRGIDGSYDVALEETETELALREEDDHVMECRYLETLVDVYDGVNLQADRRSVRDGVGAVAGQSLEPGYRLGNEVIRNPEQYRNFLFWEKGDDDKIGLIPDDDQRSPVVSYRKAYPVPLLHGMWLYKADAVREIGGFATVTNGYRGETATSLKLWWAGYSLWVAPEAVAYHIPGVPAGNSHRGIDGKNQRARCEEAFQAWLTREGQMGKPLPIDLQWQRLPCCPL